MRRRRLKRITYDPTTDYYTVVGVSPDATPDEIQQVYRQRAKEVHPDTNPDQREWATDAFQQLAEAYDVLSDPEQRARYDGLRLAHLVFIPTKQRVPSYHPPPHHTSYQLQALWRWRWVVFWAVVGIIAMIWGVFVILSRESTPATSHPLPPIPNIVWGETVGCHDQAWNITGLELELDAQNTVYALLVKGSAVTLFTVELYQDSQSNPLQGTPVRNPAYTDRLARFNTPIRWDSRYTVWLRAIDESRSACRVTFWLQ